MKPQRVVLALSALSAAVVATAAIQERAPRFEVDPLWPKPLPNHWVLGSVVGIAIDARDHVFIVHLPSSLNARTEIGAASRPPTGECCLPAPNVVEFDPAGNVVSSFGSSSAWPSSSHGIALDRDGNIWIGGSGGTDTQLLKFSRSGQLLLAAGKAADSATIAAATARQAADTTYTGVSGARPAPQRRTVSLPAASNSLDAFGGAAAVAFDAHGVGYVADGFRNRRVAVIDAKTGAIQRVWGAFANKPDDTNPRPAAQFGTPVTCAEPSRDGLVYVCDRSNNRIQVFRSNGTFVKEATVAPNTRGNGSVWDIAFSPDAQQRFLYVADGANMKVHILDRQALRVVGSFGSGGRYPGQFYAVHSVATDSKGNVYTVESLEGKRLQKWIKQ